MRDIQPSLQPFGEFLLTEQVCKEPVPRPPACLQAGSRH
jgi:hypothetical protein